MAEFCLDCWNELNETNDPPEKYVLSGHLEFCEGCGEWKQVIIGLRPFYQIRMFLSKCPRKTLPPK